MFSDTFSKSKIFSALAMIGFGVIGRFFMLKFVGIPNFEIITALTLVSAVFLGRIWGIVVPLSIIAITDVVIGNSPVLIFIWSAFAIIGVFGGTQRSPLASLCKWREQNPPLTPPKKGQNPSQPPFTKGGVKIISPFCKGGLRGILGMTGLGIISSVFFFLFTNFGWWLMTNMYPHTWGGLVQCYIMGLPFFKNNLIGNLIFVPMFSGAAMYAVYFKNNYLLKINFLKLKKR